MSLLYQHRQVSRAGAYGSGQGAETYGKEVVVHEPLHRLLIHHRHSVIASNTHLVAIHVAAHELEGVVLPHKGGREVVDVLVGLLHIDGVLVDVNDLGGTTAPQSAGGSRHC